MEMQLVDDNEDGVADRGVIDGPPMAFGRSFPGHGGCFGAGPAQVEVRLVDDDGDGVADRGVIDAPQRTTFGSKFGHGGHFDRGFSNRPFDRGFGPSFFIGGLFRLAFLALLVGLGIYFYRRWRASRSVAPADAEQVE